MYRRLLSAHILRLLAGIVGMTVAFLLANPTPARAAPIWNDSAGQQVNTINCITLSGEVLGTAYVGWYGDAATPPPVNTVYYVRMWWGVSGNPCTGGARVAPELFLPDGTTLAISATNPELLHRGDHARDCCLSPGADHRCPWWPGFLSRQPAKCDLAEPAGERLGDPGASAFDGEAYRPNHQPEPHRAVPELRDRGRVVHRRGE
jgi:hypothetical protein